MAKLVEVGVINNVGTFILFVGKFLVVIITVILGCFLMEVCCMIHLKLPVVYRPCNFYLQI